MYNKICLTFGGLLGFGSSTIEGINMREERYSRGEDSWKDANDICLAC